MLTSRFVDKGFLPTMNFESISSSQSHTHYHFILIPITTPRKDASSLFNNHNTFLNRNAYPDQRYLRRRSPRPMNVKDGVCSAWFFQMQIPMI